MLFTSMIPQPTMYKEISSCFVSDYSLPTLHQGDTSLAGRFNRQYIHVRWRKLHILGGHVIKEYVV
jgi:hypothetical protein